MTSAAQSVNLAVRFLLELALLGAVAAVAWRTVDGPVLRTAAAAAAVTAVATGWVLVVHGASVPPAVRAAGQLAALALGVWALLRLGSPRLAGGLAATALVNAALLAAWQQ